MELTNLVRMHAKMGKFLSVKTLSKENWRILTNKENNAMIKKTHSNRDKRLK